MKSLSQSQKNKHTEIPNTPLRFMWYITKSHRGIMLVSLLLVTLAQSIGTSIPYVFRAIIDSAEGVLTGMTTVSDVWFWALAYPIMIGVMFFLWRLSGFMGMRWITAANAFAYQTLFTYLGKHSHTYFSDRFAGSLSSKITHASEGAQSLYEAFVWSYFPGIVSLILTTAYIASVSAVASVIFIILLGILIPVNIYLAKYRRPHVVAYSAQTTKTRGRLVDTLTNMGAVRQYVQGNLEEDRFQHELQIMRSLNLKQWGISEWGLALNNALIVIFELFLISVIIYLWTKGGVSTGELVMTITLLMNVNGTLVFIGSSINGFIRRYAEVEEGLDDILREHEITDAEGAKHLHVAGGKIEWQDVDFEFGENKVFQNFNLTINPGERIGLVGHSGAGKSTFVSLLLRQHDLTGGALLIDGQNIKEVTQDSLRKHIAVVPQEPMLFHRSIRENVAYGNPIATQEDIEAVAKKAQAHDFIVSLPEGYDTLVGERGIKLSGGQKQRVAIARAMLKNAPILILDEATSALDSESEVAIQKALHELMENKTVVAVAHRLSTLREMDRIIVMEGGKIIENGSHQELVAKKGVYARLWEHQAGGFLNED